MRNFLTEINSDNKVTGELAESWDVSPDAKTWTLKLRKGVEFHNGKTFDANDAAASLNYHRSAEFKIGRRGAPRLGRGDQGRRYEHADGEAHHRAAPTFPMCLPTIIW